MQTKVTALIGVVLLVGVALSASAFTSATVDRSTTIDVTTDSGSIVGLSPGSSSMITDNNGELTIDVSGKDNQGVNVNSTYTFGDSSDPVNVSAFSVTNNDANQRNFTLSYAVDGTDSATNTDNVVFEVYDANKASQGTFAEGTSLTLNDVTSGGTHYVVLTVNTTNSATSDDLSGTLTVSAS